MGRGGRGFVGLRDVGGGRSGRSFAGPALRGNRGVSRRPPLRPRRRPSPHPGRRPSPRPRRRHSRNHRYTQNRPALAVQLRPRPLALSAAGPATDRYPLLRPAPVGHRSRRSAGGHRRGDGGAAHARKGRRRVQMLAPTTRAPHRHASTTATVHHRHHHPRPPRLPHPHLPVPTSIQGGPHRIAPPRRALQGQSSCHPRAASPPYSTRPAPGEGKLGQSRGPAPPGRGPDRGCLLTVSGTPAYIASI